jgi:hypothetical protein
VAPGAIDPACGDSGYLVLTEGLQRILPDPGGAIVVTNSTFRRVDQSGKLDPTSKSGGGPGVVRA